METTIQRFEVHGLNDYVKQVTGREEWAVFGVWQPTQQAEAEHQCKRLTEAGSTARVFARQ